VTFGRHASLDFFTLLLVGDWTGLQGQGREQHQPAGSTGAESGRRAARIYSNYVRGEDVAEKRERWWVGDRGSKGEERTSAVIRTDDEAGGSGSRAAISLDKGQSRG
jgi:hypothetical protein